jgi:RND family efflux transporter MFP subunit
MAGNSVEEVSRESLEFARSWHKMKVLPQETTKSMEPGGGAEAVRAREVGRRGQLARLLAGVSLCAATLFLAGCGAKNPSANQTAGAVPVKTSVAENVSIPETTEYLATLKSRHSTTINPQVEGQITKIFVKSGDRVAAGKPLIQIDPLKQEATVGSQEAARSAQVANVAYAKQQLDRSKKLFEAGIVARQDLDQTQSAYDAAEKQLESLESQVQEQQVQLHYYSVVAPTDGIIGDVPVRVGDRVTTATMLTTVDQPGSLEAYISVPVENAGKLRMGLPVQLLDPNGKEMGETSVDFISSQADSGTQSILVKATVSNPKDELRTLQFARARIVWGTHEGTTIPILAATRINGQYFAFVAEKSGGITVAKQRLLHLGELIGNSYVVLDGIKAGDHVIVEGTQFLVDGVPVSESTADTASGTPAA